ncbi:MAG: rod shape-determining protein MreD [Sporolactobacillus sp.]
MKTFKIFIALFAALIVQESIMPLVLPVSSAAGLQFVPDFLLVLLLLAAFPGHLGWSLCYAIIFGLIIDCTSTQLLGVYAFGMTLSVYLTFQLSRFMNMNVASVLLLCLTGVFINQSFIYLINLTVGATSLAPLAFASDHLLPTLLLNGAFTLLFFYPMERLVRPTAK